jgi:hypothetical protein
MPGLVLKKNIQAEFVVNLQDGGIPEVFSVVRIGSDLTSLNIITRKESK